MLTMFASFFGCCFGKRWEQLGRLIACASLGNDNLCLLADMVWSYEVHTTGRIAVRLEGRKERRLVNFF